MSRRFFCRLFAVLLLSSSEFAYAVKNLKLTIPKDQAIVVEVPPAQWATKETSWNGFIPISVLRADKDFIGGRLWEDGSLPSLIEFHIEKAQDCGSGVISGRIVGCPPNWKQIELRNPTAWAESPVSAGDIRCRSCPTRDFILWVGSSIRSNGLLAQ